MRRLLKVGDTIKCADKEDCVNVMVNLAIEGIETDFLYEKDGEQGLWLEVISIGAKKQ